MNKEKLQDMIEKMLHPGITINSLAMFAGKLIKKYGQEGLEEFLAALSRMDIYKAMTITGRLAAPYRAIAENYITRELADRCEHEERFSYLELLAIAVCKDEALLRAVSCFLTPEMIEAAMEGAEHGIACSLLQLGLTTLPQETGDQMQKAFCKLLSARYNERMEKDLRALLPTLLEQDAADVLGTLVEIIGAERVSDFCGEELTEVLDRMILSGKDGVGIWKLFFFRFFQQERTQEELLKDGLWYVQLFASEEIYDQVCAGFFLQLAARCGVDHPILAYIDDLSSLEDNSWEYLQQYKDAIRPLWEEPHNLSRFLQKTASCNPFRNLEVLGERYHLLTTAQDRIAYGWLQGLFEAGLPVGDISTVFLSTELKQRLPLQDLFYLAQRYEVLAELLEALRDRPFAGRITGRYSHQLFMSPYSYFSTELHTVPVNYKILEIMGNVSQLKGHDLQYTIVGFEGGSIRVASCDTATLSESKESDAMTWEAAIEQLRQEKFLQYTSKKKLQSFIITKFTLDDVIKEDHMDQFTELIAERPDCLVTFLKLMRICKWNTSFQKAGLPLPDDLFSKGRPYQKKALELFRFLSATGGMVYLVLQLYFFSIYRAIIPLDQLLLFIPREFLLEHLSIFVVTCRPLESGRSLFRLDNINCDSICYMDNIGEIPLAEPLEVVISDFVVEDNRVAEIFLQPYYKGASDVKERGALFGTLGSSIQIPQHLQKRIALLPPASQYGYRELKFNVRCMEDAFLLRRSDAAELKHLIQILGDANPFRFGFNLTVEKYYLSKIDRKKDVANTIVSMVLNAESIEDIRDFYLHTHIKFHLQLPQLAALIRERRPALEDQISGMFEDVVFYAISDSCGNVWMPRVPQNTLKVSPEYAGKVLSCGIRLEKNGEIRINVKEAKESNAFFPIMAICLLSGYLIEPNMDALAKNLQMSMMNREPQAGIHTPSFGEYFSQLLGLIPDEQFSYEDFTRSIQKLITNYTKISITRMEHAIVTLIQKWVEYRGDRERIPLLLQKIFNHFDQKYPDGYRHGDLFRQLSLYLGDETVQEFQTQMRNAATASRESTAEVRDKDTFADSCEKLMEAIHALYSLKRIAALIKSYYETISQEELVTGISALTAKRLQTHSSDDKTLRDLILIHTEFLKYCSSGSMGLVLIQQGYQYLPPDMADRLERGICKYTYRFFQERPELIQMLPPYEQWLGRLKTRLLNPQYPLDDAAKRIGKLIRFYHTNLSAEEMEQTILELMEPLVKQLSLVPNVNQLLKRLNTSFEKYYGVSNVGRALWQRLCQQLKDDIACASQSSQPMSGQTFISRIGSLTLNHYAYISKEEMEPSVLRLSEQWLADASEEDAVSALFTVYNHLAITYNSKELGDDLCKLLEKYMGKNAVEDFVAKVHDPFPLLL